jgi:hypothetical protein
MSIPGEFFDRSEVVWDEMPQSSLAVCGLREKAAGDGLLAETAPAQDKVWM